MKKEDLTADMSQEGNRRRKKASQYQAVWKELVNRAPGSESEGNMAACDKDSAARSTSALI